MTPQPQRICDICGVVIHAQPTAFHPDGPAEGKQRWAHLSCASKYKAAQAEARSRLEGLAGEMLEMLEGMRDYILDSGGSLIIHPGTGLYRQLDALVKKARGEGT